MTLARMFVLLALLDAAFAYCFLALMPDFEDIVGFELAPLFHPGALTAFPTHPGVIDFDLLLANGEIQFVQKHLKVAHARHVHALRQGVMQAPAVFLLEDIQLLELVFLQLPLLLEQGQLPGRRFHPIDGQVMQGLKREVARHVSTR